MSKNFEDLQERLKAQHPQEWDRFPDIDIYMDQLLSYMVRQHIGLDSGEEALTAGMVNNYVKQGLLPRTNGKKYNREHIADLTSVCLLKQVMPISSVQDFKKLSAADENPEESYRRYHSTVCRVLDEVAAEVGRMEEDGYDAVLDFAVKSYAYRFAALSMLKELKEEAESSASAAGKSSDGKSAAAKDAAK